MSEQQRLPEASELVLTTVASLVNLAGIRLTEEEHKDAGKAKEAIDAARQLLPLCPEEAVGPIKDALSQLQMIYAREVAQPGEAPGPAPAKEEPKSDPEREKARSKLWTPPGT